MEEGLNRMVLVVLFTSLEQQTLEKEVGGVSLHRIGSVAGQQVWPVLVFKFTRILCRAKTFTINQDLSFPVSKMN